MRVEARAEAWIPDQVRDDDGGERQEMEGAQPVLLRPIYQLKFAGPRLFAFAGVIKS
jgi:hypothetical protein